MGLDKMKKALIPGLFLFLLLTNIVYAITPAEEAALNSQNIDQCMTELATRDMIIEERINAGIDSCIAGTKTNIKIVAFSTAIFLTALEIWVYCIINIIHKKKEEKRKQRLKPEHAPEYRG